MKMVETRRMMMMKKMRAALYDFLEDERGDVPGCSVGNTGVLPAL